MRDGKIVLHIGGVYGDREAALDRFARRFAELPEAVRLRLVIENDERSFAIDQVWAMAKRLGIPAILDTLHYALLPPNQGDLLSWIDRCAATWKKRDGAQKIHYSQQLPGGKPGSHSATINAAEFAEFYRSLGDRRCAVMLEVKDKNLSAIKCMDVIQPAVPRSVLTESWAQYKYTVLERSPAIYNRIRQFLKNDAPSAAGYYALIDDALAEPLRSGPAITAFQHVWGYFKKTATPTSKRRAAEYETKIAADLHHLRAAKGFLFRLAEENGDTYLLNSLYFDL